MSRRAKKAALEAPRVVASVSGKVVLWGKGSDGVNVSVGFSCAREEDAEATGLRAFAVAERILAARKRAAEKAAAAPGTTGPKRYPVGNAGRKYSEAHGSVTPAQKKCLEELFEKSGLLIDKTWAAGLSEAEAAAEITKRQKRGEG